MAELEKEQPLNNDHHVVSWNPIGKMTSKRLRVREEEKKKWYWELEGSRVLINFLSTILWTWENRA